MDYKTTSEGIKYSSREYGRSSVMARKENNDCVVRAFAAAFDIEYNEAHQFAKEFFDRVNGRGTRAVELILAGMDEQFGKKIKQMGRQLPGMIGLQMKWPYRGEGEIKWRSYTTGKFLESFTSGVYIILVSGHAFCIRDGIVDGNYTDALKLKTRIEAAFKIT